MPTFLAPSAIHGVGVFAAAPISAGTVIWEYVEGVDWRLAPDELSSFPEPFQARLRHYCYLEEDSGMYVLCGDNAKFMNHSFEPNCLDPDGPVTVTARDVSAGEELTCDYRAFDVESAGRSLDGVSANEPIPMPLQVFLDASPGV